ncbi:MAG: hypothetical protein ACTSRP_02130 [Candidatus Helarchaeota archaeon]
MYMLRHVIREELARLMYNELTKENESRKEFEELNEFELTDYYNLADRILVIFDKYGVRI